MIDYANEQETVFRQATHHCNWLRVSGGGSALKTAETLPLKVKCSSSFASSYSIS